jgi:hypothetical protein
LASINNGHQPLSFNRPPRPETTRISGSAATRGSHRTKTPLLSPTDRHYSALPSFEYPDVLNGQEGPLPFAIPVYFSDISRLNFGDKTFKIARFFSDKCI